MTTVRGTHATAWGWGDYFQPSDVLAAIVYQHPELCCNRTDALHYLLCTDNPGWVWRNGGLIPDGDAAPSSPLTNAAAWWQQLGTNNRPVPATVRDHMRNRRARIIAVREAANELAHTSGPITGVWLPAPASLLLSEPPDVQPDWKDLCTEAWAIMLSVHTRLDQNIQP